MKRKKKGHAVRTPTEMAAFLGLSPADGVEMNLRASLNSKIVEVVARNGLTHAQVAKLAGTSRTRVTAILNGNTVDISTDLMLRVLYALGYSAKISFHKAA